MIRNSTRRTPPRGWRVYSARDGRVIDQQLRERLTPQCPGCGEVLEAQPETRLARRLPLGARGHDLCCRGCRRFWCVICHTERSLRILRMRRLAAAVRAVRIDSAGERDVGRVVVAGVAAA